MDIALEKIVTTTDYNNLSDCDVIIEAATENQTIKEKILFALNIKPKKHDFIIEKNTKPYMKRHMNVTGG